jgi:hypothetical protein
MSVDGLFSKSLIRTFLPMGSLQMMQRSVETASTIFKINITGGELACYNVCWTPAGVQD